MGSDRPKQIELCDRKYKVVIDHDTRTYEVLRHNEKWRDITGDKLILAMFDEIVELRIALSNASAHRDELERASFTDRH